MTGLMGASDCMQKYWAARARQERMASALEAAQDELAASHAKQLAHESERRGLGEQLAKAQSAVLKEKEKNALLVRKLAATEVMLKVVHREVQHADANASQLP